MGGLLTLWSPLKAGRSRAGEGWPACHTATLKGAPARQQKQGQALECKYTHLASPPSRAQKGGRQRPRCACARGCCQIQVQSSQVQEHMPAARTCHEVKKGPPEGLAARGGHVSAPQRRGGGGRRARGDGSAGHSRFWEGGVLAVPNWRGGPLCSGGRSRRKGEGRASRPGQPGALQQASCSDKTEAQRPRRA